MKVVKEIWSDRYGSNKTEGLQKWLLNNVSGYKRQHLPSYIQGFSEYIGKLEKMDTPNLASNNFSKWTKFVKERLVIK